ncbi:response regulator transcription factor [Fibrivirga algicola]|jgi:two-component system OmpR family response regulator|uniref:Response regulator transcription factor n=1 Tax=Fibrivirga algicola TaxID=2950420 RepID=A0ABX0QRJ8_9BACT|nr:response regulator transcription factor [Fibrivirga algicola]NID13612.1 response regulator transcription factor [Fibrivirga algicola]
MKILLVEDEPSLLQAMRQYLEVDGYIVTTATTFAKASMDLNDYDYDCVVVDIGLPDGNGLNLIRQLKTAEKGSGLIIISAKDSLDDKLTGLELGSDDYITKPFHLPELNARIKSVLRRRFFGGNNLIRYGEIVVDPLSHQVTVADHRLDLTEKEYHLLLFFLANVNRLLTKSAIAEYVWGDHMDLADSHDFLYTHIKNLRRKLIDAGCPDYIKTRYGAGYLFATL